VLLLAGACSGQGAPAPSSHRVVYRVVDDAGATSTTTVDVAPPYRARTVTRSAGGTTTGFAWDARGLYTITDSGAVQTSEVAPGAPGPYSGLAVSLPLAEQQHLVTRAGASTVLGHACTTWVSREPLDGAPFAPATRTDHTSTCVDAAGVLLSDDWYVGGRSVRTRTATFVGDGPSLVGDGLFGGRPTPLPSKGTAFVIQDAEPGELARLMQVPLPAAPPGFHPDASVVVLDRSEGGFSREAFVLTWLRGTSLVTLRVERDLSGTSKGSVRGAAVDVGLLGAGHLEPQLNGLRLVVDGPAGLRFIATADLAPAELLRWVRSLRFRAGP
jgi:hypothetical protein